MNLLLLALFNPKEAFSQACEQNILIILLVCFLGTGFFFFTINEAFSYFDVGFNSYLIFLLSDFPYSHLLNQLQLPSILTSFLKLMITGSIVSAVITIWVWLWGNVFSALDQKTIVEYFKASVILIYSLSVWFIIVDVIQWYFASLYIFYILYFLMALVLLSLYYSALYYINLVQSFMNLIIGIIAVALLLGAGYSTYLIMTEESVEQQFKEHFDNTVDKLEN